MAEEVISSSAEATASFGAAILSTVPTSTANVVSSAALRTIVPVESTAAATSAVLLNSFVVLTSAAVAASTLAVSNGTEEILSSDGVVQDSLTCGLETIISSAGAATSAAVLRHFAIMRSEAAVVDAALATLRATLASAANATSKCELSSTMVLESTAAAVSTLGPFKLRGTLVSSAVGSATAEPYARVVFVLQSAAVGASTLDSKLTAKQTLTSTADAEAFVRLPAAAIESFWTNTLTTAAARWTSLKLNSIVEKDGVLYGAGVDGVHELTDAGAHEGEVMWDLMNFGSPQLKTVDSVYMNGTAGGAMTVRVAVDDGAWQYNTHRTAATTKAVNHRTTLGRGLKAVDYRISIKAGHAFDIGDVYLQIAEAARRIGG